MTRTGATKHLKRTPLRWVIALVAVLTAGAMSLPAGTASAYFNDTLTGCIVTDDVRWKFDSSFPSTMKNAVRAAFDSIEEALDYDGTPLVTLTEVSSPPYTLVFVNDDLPPASGYGEATCGIKMWINGRVNADKFIWHVARHEMMHLLQATHGGRYDSVPEGEQPATMSTCVNYDNFRNVNKLERDAEAYLNWLHSDLSYRQINSNIGFDNGTTGWGGTMERSPSPRAAATQARSISHSTHPAPQPTRTFAKPSDFGWVTTSTTSKFGPTFERKRRARRRTPT